MSIDEIKMVVNKMLHYQEQQWGFKAPWRLHKFLSGNGTGSSDIKSFDWGATDEGLYYWISLLGMGSDTRIEILKVLLLAPPNGYTYEEQTETHIIDNQTYVV